MFAAFRNVPLSSLFVDVALCFLAVVLASVVTPNLVGDAHLLTLNWLLALAAAFALTAVFMFACLGLYRPARLRFSAAFWRMLTAVIIAGCLAYPIFEATLGANYASLFLPRAVWCLAGCLLAGKYAGRRLRKALRVPRVLIVGTGPEAAMVARDFRESKTMQRNVIGYVATPQDPSIAAADLGKAQVFPDSESISDLAHRHGIDEIVVAVRDQRGGNVPMDQLLACRIRGIPVLDLAGCFERARSEVPLDSLKSSWLVYGKGFEQGKVRHIVKRVIDLAGSLVLLTVAAPVMLFAAIAVHLTSPGPILYRQERVGFGGKVFMCLKFRSMRNDAEKDGVARWASKNDSRVTPVGAFMRKTRIDELPQLFSVLRGEMSLIGPRPERPTFVAELRKHIPFYDLRHSIKPGLTGWAQVRSGYGASIEDARRKHQFDLYYVKNNSLVLDLLVLIETVSVVVFREGQ
jgi:sugar transferase (PEP-CTERM system associated)